MEQQQIQQELQHLQANLPFLLSKIRSLEEEMALIDRTNPDWIQAVPTLEQLRTYLLQELAPHLQDAQTYFTGAAQQFQGHEKVMWLQEQAAELSQRIQEFRAAIALENYVGAETRPSLLWDLLSAADALVSHARTFAALELDLLRDLLPSRAEAEQPAAADTPRRGSR